MIVVDNLVEYPAGMTTDKGLPGRRWCHMSSTLTNLAEAEIELRAMAIRIGMRAHGIQHQGRSTMHYDLTPMLRDRAIRAGAGEVSAYAFARSRLRGHAAIEALVSRTMVRSEFDGIQPLPDVNRQLDGRE